MDKLDVLWFPLLHIQLPFPIVVPEGTSMEQFETYTSAGTSFRVGEKKKKTIK